MEDQRSPDQDTAIEQAFIAGTLPDADRRAAFDITTAIAAGYVFSSSVNGWDVVGPSGHGNGPTAEDAVLNIGAQIIPVSGDEYSGRLLIRVDGSEVQLDRRAE